MKLVEKQMRGVISNQVQPIGGWDLTEQISCGVINLLGNEIVNQDMNQLLRQIHNEVYWRNHD